MSILFKGRAKGASSAKVGFVQSIVMFFVSHVRHAKRWRVLESCGVSRWHL